MMRFFYVNAEDAICVTWGDKVLSYCERAFGKLNLRKSVQLTVSNACIFGRSVANFAQSKKASFRAQVYAPTLRCRRVATIRLQPFGKGNVFCPPVKVKGIVVL